MKKLFLIAIAVTSSILDIVGMNSDIPLIEFGKNANLLDTKKPHVITNVNPIPVNGSSLQRALFHIVANPLYLINQDDDPKHIITNLENLSIVDTSFDKYINHPNVIRHIISYISGDKHQDIVAKALKLRGAKNYLEINTDLYIFLKHLGTGGVMDSIKKGADPNYYPHGSLPIITQAQRYGLHEKREMLIELGAYPHDRPCSLKDALVKRDASLIMEAIVYWGTTLDGALEIAIKMDKEDIVALVLELGANPEPQVQKLIKNEAIFTLLCSALKEYKSLYSALATKNKMYILDTLQKDNINLIQALEFTMQHNDSNGTALLLDIAASIEEDCSRAIQSKNLTKMKWFLENKTNPNERLHAHLYELVALMVTNMFDGKHTDLVKNLDIVELLCQHGAYHPDAIEIVESANNMPDRLLQALKKGRFKFMCDK